MRFLALFHFEAGAMAHLTPEDMRQLDDATIRHDQKLRAAATSSMPGRSRVPKRPSG